MEYNHMIILLYLFIGLIGLVILLYLLLSSGNDRTSKTLPLTLLKIILNFLLSVLYMPIIDLFVSIFTCNADERHFQFQQITCWQGSQAVHSVVSILFLTVFYLLTAVLAFIYFESRLIYSNSHSKLSGYDDFVLKSYIFLQVLNYHQTSSQYIQIIVIVMGSVVLYVYNYLNNSHNNLVIYKIKQITVSINIWTAIMLTFSKLLEGIIFKGTIYAWLLGIPLLVLIVVQNPEERYDLMMQDPQKATSAQIQFLNHHLLRLHKWGGSLYNLIVEGYMKIHVQTCQRPDCVKTLVKIVQQNYQDAIKRFPYDYQLKIRYGFFLLDFLNLRQQALNEFNQAYSLNPTLDCEFIIYRYKKVIEEEMSDQNYEMLDQHNEIQFANSSKQFQQKVERTTLLQMDFWAQLQEEVPDLGRLNKLGLQIQACIEDIQLLWRKILKFKLNSQKILRIYSRFMIDVVQDQEFGDQLLEKIRIMDTSYARKGITLATKDEISQESLPTLLISFSQEKFAQIINLNLACHVFGYMKSELINRKINILVPNLFQKLHDQLLKGGFDSKLSKERFIFIRNKQNYIMPCSIEMKSLQSPDGTLQIAAQFKMLKSFKQTMYILFDNDDIIDSLSQNCIAALGIELKYIQNKKLLISELFPALNGDRDDFLGKEGGLIKYNLSEELISSIQINSNEQIEESRNRFSQEFHCQIIPKFLMNQRIGFILKLESKDCETIPIPLKKQKCNFQFKYNLLKRAFIAEYSNDQSSGIQDASSIQDQSGDQSAILQSQQINQSAQQDAQPGDEIVRPNYAEGIKTLQLFQNRIQEFDKDDNMEDAEEEALQQQIVFQGNLESQRDQEGGQNLNIFRSRLALMELLENQGDMGTIKKLKWWSNIIFVFLVALGFLEYFYINQQFNEIETNVTLIDIENQMHSRLQMSLTAIQNLKYLNFGIWQNTSSAFETQQKEILTSQLLKIQELNNVFLQTSLSFTAEFDRLRQEDSIPMQFSSSVAQKYDFMEATQQVISKGLEVARLNLTQIVSDHPSVFFIEYNLLNSYWISLRNISNELIISLQSRTTSTSPFEVSMVSVSAIILFLTLLVYIICILLIAQKITDFLQLFLDIPEKTIKYFQGKCENFITNLQVGEEEDNASLQDELEKEEQHELNKTLKARKRKKKFMNSNQNQKEQILIFFIILLCIQAYYLFTYFLTANTLEQLSAQISEYNITVRCDAFYRFCDNAERQLFFDRKMKILEIDSYTAVKENIKTMYAFDTSMQQLHALNVDIQNPSYRQIYDSIMMSDPCQKAEELKAASESTCQAFARGALAQGMSIGVARYIENIRYIMTIYDKFYGKGAANFTAIARGDAVAKQIVTNREANNILNLNNFNQTKESRTFQSTYLMPLFHYLVESFIESYQSDIDIYKASKLAVFIIYIGLLFFLQFLLAYPYLYQLNKQIKNTRLLITMIPTRLMLKINSIKSFVKETVNLQDSNY